ncbi:hypothetical protein IscW_ISCW016335, partial [Ixodes scapularis]
FVFLLLLCRITVALFFVFSPSFSQLFNLSARIDTKQKGEKRGSDGMAGQVHHGSPPGLRVSHAPPPPPPPPTQRLNKVYMKGTSSV